MHNDANVFDFYGTFLFPQGYGKDKTPFETWEAGTSLKAEFWVEKGRVIGLALNGLAGEETESQRLGGSITDTAEIWMEKM